MRTVISILFICLAAAACNQPEVTVTPVEPEDIAATPEVSPEERMRASVSVWVKKSGNDGGDYLYGEPGLHLGNGVILTNSMVTYKHAGTTWVRYWKADGTSAEMPIHVLMDGPPGAVAMILMKTGRPLPIPAAEFREELPDLESRVRTHQCLGIVGSVNMTRGEYRFGIWLQQQSDDCYHNDCEMSEAVYDLEGRVLGVCNGHDLGPYWQPDGYGRTLFGVLSSRDLKKMLERHNIKL